MNKKFDVYTIDDYKLDLDTYGLKNTWSNILDYCKSYNGSVHNDILQINNFGELYEIGLAHINKLSKKVMGKYYTPKDVAFLMAKYFNTLPGKIICDVGCGVGNLILAYLEYIGKQKARTLIFSDLLYLYDMDEIALEICKTSIALLYGLDCLPHIHCIIGDFLSRDITLPSDCKVLSNPPYFKITKYDIKWEVTKIMEDSKEYYSSFMEKILKTSRASVLITPFSFLGGNKFYSLRRLLNDYNGSIFSFDNVPSSIFNGHKHGIFNSNSSNSVRVAITIVENKSNVRGFRVSPFIRFQTSERSDLLNEQFLESLLPQQYNLISKSQSKYPKCFKTLQPIYDRWIYKSSGTFKELLSNEITNYKLDVPTTCRYFVSATKKDLQRKGKYILYFKDEPSYYYAYCLLNSSFAYWYWRLFDGNIIYPLGLLYEVPIFMDLCTLEKFNLLKELVDDLQKQEKDFLVYKKNVSDFQENVKFPHEYRYKLNNFLLDLLGIEYISNDIFDCIHANHIVKD